MSRHKFSELRPMGYASFFQRTQAFVIDSLVFFPMSYLTDYNLFYIKNFYIVVAAGVLWWAYKILMEWQFGATLGKMVVKIKVVSEDMDKPSFNQIMMRFMPYFAVGLSNILLNFSLFNLPEFQTVQDLDGIQKLHEQLPSTGLMLSIFFFSVSVGAIWYDEKKQALHDKLGQTYCVEVGIPDKDEDLTKEEW